jgi:glycosyltransferase involved in cell wall biosynthesis
MGKLIKRAKDIFFGVKMVTCNREKWKPMREIVTETIQSVSTQTYPHWRLYLIGDRYEPEEEFRALAGILPPEKVVAYNLKGHRTEREVFRHPWHVIQVAGNTASNFCLDLMENTGVRYVACLDDDDLWQPDHLESLRKGLIEFPHPALVCTMANFRNEKILPKWERMPDGSIKVRTLYNNVVHSSVAWNMRRLPLRYRRRVIECAWAAEYADADMWQQMEKRCKEAEYPVTVVPKITVEYR